MQQLCSELDGVVARRRRAASASVFVVGAHAVPHAVQCSAARGMRRGDTQHAVRNATSAV